MDYGNTKITRHAAKSVRAFRGFTLDTIRKKKKKKRGCVKGLLGSALYDQACTSDIDYRPVGCYARKDRRTVACCSPGQSGSESVRANCRTADTSKRRIKGTSLLRSGENKQTKKTKKKKNPKKQQQTNNNNKKEEKTDYLGGGGGGGGINFDYFSHV